VEVVCTPPPVPPPSGGGSLGATVENATAIAKAEAASICNISNFLLCARAALVSSKSEARSTDNAGYTLYLISQQLEITAVPQLASVNLESFAENLFKCPGTSRL
jgi:hypothetical protein